MDERLIHPKESLENFLTFTLESSWWMLLGKISQTVGFTIERGLPWMQARWRVEGEDRRPRDVSSCSGSVICSTKSEFPRPATGSVCCLLHVHSVCHRYAVEIRGDVRIRGGKAVPWAGTVDHVMFSF